MTKLNEIQKIMLVLVFVIIIIFAAGMIIYTIDYRNKDWNREINAGIVRGCIYAYAEPDEDDDMHLYIVVGRYGNMHLLGLTEAAYSSMDADLKSAIDSRKTGFYVEFSTVTNKYEKMYNGFKRISMVVEYNLYGTASVDVLVNQ